MVKMVKLGALGVLTLPMHLVVWLVLMGVPKPPAITTEGIDRVAWRPALDDAVQLWRARESTAIAGWMPDGSGVLVQTRRWLLDARFHHVPEPGVKPVFLSPIPRNPGGVYSAPGRPYMIFAKDTDGDEQHRLYRWDIDDTDPVLITGTSERSMFGAFEPDGSRIAYTSTRRNGRDFDVYVMDPTDPTTDRRVLEVEGTWAVADWSPAGGELLLVHVESSMSTTLHVLDLGTGRVTRVSEISERGVRHGSPQWSRDGHALLYSSDRDTEFRHLRRLDLDSGQETVLSDEIPWDVESVQQSADGDLLLVSVNEDGRTRHYLRDPMGEDMRPLDLFGSGQISVSLHRTEPWLAVNHVDPSGISRGYVYDLRTDELTLWAGEPPGERALPEPRLVRYPTFDEVDGRPRTIPAFVYPGEGEGPRPVVIDIHGGPEAQARLRSAPHPLQRVGITVIAPNVRGSTGYGRTFASLDDVFLREDAVRDIGSLLDWIGDEPDLDPGRVAVIGGSYGGYMVLASLVHYSPRLACGVDVVGVSNFVTFLENTAEYRRDLRRAEYGDERIPEVRAFLESISPLNHAERIASPLMVVQGANDPRVPVDESRQLVERVRGTDLSVSYMEASNEGHGFRRPWNAFYAALAQRQMLRECLSAG